MTISTMSGVAPCIDQVSPSPVTSSSKLRPGLAEEVLVQDCCIARLSPDVSTRRGGDIHWSAVVSNRQTDFTQKPSSEDDERVWVGPDAALETCRHARYADRGRFGNKRLSPNLDHHRLSQKANAGERDQ